MFAAPTIDRYDPMVPARNTIFDSTQGQLICLKSVHRLVINWQRIIFITQTPELIIIIP